MNKQQALMKHYTDLYSEIENETSLVRFDKPCVYVSDLAEQVFCEVSPGMTFKYEEMTTKGMETGSAGHEAIESKYRTVEQEEMVHHIFTQRITCIPSIVFKRNGIIIAGRPDSVTFSRGKAILLVEHKFTAKPVRSPFPRQIIQAELYCLGLSEMGLNTSQLEYILQIFPMECARCDYIDGLCPARMPEPLMPRQIFESNYHKCPSIDKVQNFKYRYSENSINNTLNNLLRYWSGEIEATSTTNPNKCRGCRFRQICPHAIS